jgi:hypothetical protein
LGEAVELDDAGIAQHDFHFEAFGCTAPLRGADVAVVEGEGVAAARRLPPEPRLCESALSCLFREVEIDAVETFPGGSRMSVLFAPSERSEVVRRVQTRDEAG